MKKSENKGLFRLSIFYFILIMISKMNYMNNNESLNLFILGNWKDNNTGQLFRVTEDVEHLKIECNHRIVAENLDIVFISKYKCIFKDVNNNKYEFKKKDADKVDYCIVSKYSNESECPPINLTKIA